MKFIYLFFIYIFCFILINSCNTNFVSANYHEYNSDEERIIGTWNCIRTTGGFAGVDFTPQSTSKTARLIFNNNIVKSFVNDSLVYALNYELGHNQTIFSLDSMSVLYIEDNQVFAYYFLDDNTLGLSENYVDGFNFEYIRKIK